INIDDPTPPPPPQGCPVGQHLENGQCVPDSPPPPGTGFLLVITDVVNNNGGTKTSSDIDITVNGNNPVPSNFKGSQSPLAKIIALTEGVFSLTVNNNFGYQTKFLNDCAGTIKAQETHVCVINLDDPITTVSSGSPQGCPAGQHFDQTTQTCVPDLPPPPQGCPAGQHFDQTTQTCVPDLPPPPQGCPAGQHFDQTTQTCVPDLPPSGGVFPVQGINWMYDSKQTLSNDISLPSGKTHPTDKVLLSSGASGVNSHPIKNGWLEIQSGGGNGRVYWNYHELPQYSQLDTAGFNTVMTGTFKLKPGIENLSIKDGNHGTNGWVLDGKLVFGGFGFSIHRTEVQSKAEYWHNRQGQEVASQYPNGITLQNDKEYKFFATMITDRINQEVVLNVWLDFGDGKGWVLIMKDRKWAKSGWSPDSVPNGDDKSQIENGPSSIKKHHVWTRANGSGDLPVKDIRIGTIGFIS
ncbi:MAG TPA: hypothetical protein VLA74_07970, partial [Nitrososphaeraceae archaeon]|nr:hypothetical protein [Nitrososphaeraceae archaeon]